MRLAIDHLTSYRFTEPQARVVQMLRLTPSDHDGQTVIDWRIDVDCDVRLKPGRDGFGNAIHMLYADGPVSAVGIAVRGEALIEDRSGMLAGTAEPVPPALFRRSTALTAPDAALDAFAHEVASGPDPLARLHALNAAIHRKVTASAHRGSEGAAQALAAGKASKKDLAHLFIAAAHALRVPARFVSGHCLHCVADEFDHTAHSWAEAHVEGLGWVGFCPTFGMCPDERYVRVAAGLDARSAAPVSGTRRGGGGEALDVRVGVAQA